MTNVNFDFIEDYLRSLIPDNPPLLKELEHYAKEHHIPIVERETEEFIKFIVDLKKPKKVLELGTAIGYFSISLAREECIDGIVTVEIREEMVEQALANVKKANMEEKVEVVHQDAYDYLRNCKESFDLIFIDAAKGQYEKYFVESLKHLNKGGIIICDNVLFRGMIANPDLVKRRKITIVKRLRRFLANIEKDQQFISSIVPIGDGVLLIRRKHEG
ncbi:MAG: O-methyltransferase [Tissierellia bacterium]|nr:O-methyltransferase [Tissierellia bacterium]